MFKTGFLHFGLWFNHPFMRFTMAGWCALPCLEDVAKFICTRPGKDLLFAVVLVVAGAGLEDVKVAPDPHSFCWLQLPWHRLQTVAYVGPFPGWMMLERWHFALLQVLLFQQIISSLSRSPHNRHLPETVSSIWGFMVRGHGQGFVKHLLCVCTVIGTSSFVLIG